MCLTHFTRQEKRTGLCSEKGQGASCRPVMGRPHSGVSEGADFSHCQAFEGQDASVLHLFSRSVTCCYMQMCQGKGQRRSKYQRAAGEGRRDPAECQGLERTSCFPGRRSGRLRNYSYLHLQELVPDTQMMGWLGTKEGGIDRWLLQRWE